MPDEYFDGFYVGDYNATDDYYNTYDYGQGSHIEVSPPKRYWYSAYEPESDFPFT